MHGKRVVIIAVIILVVAAGLLWLATRSITPSVPVVQNQPVPAQTNSPKELSKKLRSEEETYYKITAYYPETGNQLANKTMQAFIADQVVQFKQDTGVENIDPKHAKEMGLSSEYKYTLNIDYIPVLANDVYNYVFTIDTDTGGAHSNQFTKTFSYTADGAEITLADLFVPKSNYLTVISNYVQTELGKRDGADQKWIADGAGPKADNYQSFDVQDSGIEFIFDPYQVAAYAAGTQKVLVPYTALSSVLKSAQKH